MRVKWNNDEVFYEKSGKGPALILLHGFGEDHHIWHQQVEWLEKKFTVITPDLPGTGKSGLTVETPSLSDFAGIISLIMEQEKLSAISLIGHSMGGYISMAFVKKHPEKIRTLTLFHSSVYADDEEKKTARLKAIGFIRENGTELFLKSTIPALFYDQEKNKKNIDDLVKNNSCSADTLIAYYKAMIGREDTSSVLQNLPVPVLFIIGEHDKAVPFNIGLKQSHLPDLSYVYILRESAHMGMLEETPKSNEILAKFLQESYL